MFHACFFNDTGKVHGLSMVTCIQFRACSGFLAVHLKCKRNATQTTHPLSLKLIFMSLITSLILNFHEFDFPFIVRVPPTGTVLSKVTLFLQSADSLTGKLTQVVIIQFV